MPPEKVPDSQGRAQHKTRQQALRYALDCLGRREHCRAELLRKLRARGNDEAAAATLLDTLENAGHLSEARFVESFIRSRARRGCGPQRIRRELLQRGAQEDCIEAGLQAADCDWQALAKRMHRRKFGERTPASFEERALHCRYLESRGFDREMIREAVGEQEA